MKSMPWSIAYMAFGACRSMSKADVVTQHAEGIMANHPDHDAPWHDNHNLTAEFIMPII